MRAHTPIPQDPSIYHPSHPSVDQAMEEAMQMGLVNVVVPLADLDVTTAVWCREMLRNSPSALRFIKNAVNAADDGHAGLQQLGGDLTVRDAH